MVSSIALSLNLVQALAAQSIYTPYYFSTLAGIYGNQEGPAAAVAINPLTVAADNVGNVYFVENNAIFKITPGGFVIKFAGLPNVRGRSDGPGEVATFDNPAGIAVDAVGNLYVADSTNNTIRKITPGGVVTTLAGTPGVQGSADGAGSAAQFWGPEGVAVDGAGNVYVADTRNDTIRKVSPEGTVSTLAGTPGVPGSADGTGAAAQFNWPSGVAVDTAGNVYVLDSSLGLIREITPTGAVTTLMGESGEGAGIPDGFIKAEGVAVDQSGNVFVAAELDTIWEITPGDTATVLAGGSYGTADGTGGQAEFTGPHSIAVDSAGNLYVADGGAVRKVTQGGVVTTVAGVSGIGSMDGTGAAARFNAPQGVAVDTEGNVYVADNGNVTIRKIAPGGVVTTLAGTPGRIGSADGTGAAARFDRISGVAVDASGNLYVTDYAENTVRKITPAGVVTTLAGTPGIIGSADGTGAAAKFSAPSGVAVDTGGNVYVADTMNGTIRKITSGGVVTTLAGTAGVFGSVDGTGTAAHFVSPRGLAVDASGNVYVADANIPPSFLATWGIPGNTIRKVSPQGVVTTLAGTPGVYGSADGTGPDAQFLGPNGITVDGTGSLYITDTAASVAPWGAILPSSQSHTIRRITPGGVVTTLAGSATSGFADGLGALAQFNMPFGIAIDGNGNVFVSDNGNNTIRVGAFNKATSRASEPSLASNPSSQMIASGSTVVFSVFSGTVPAPSYQWYFDGTPIAGATQPTLIVDDATTANEGDYGCVATNALGISTGAATLTVVETADPGRLINLSCRSLVGTDANVLIVGFVIGGSGTLGTETLLVRASGPALVPFGVTGVLPDPDLQIISSNTDSFVGANNGWGGSALLSSAAAAVGAFSWANPSSRDSALIETLPIGPYTALVAGSSGDSGVALAELYDATPNGTYSPATSRLINISARTMVGQGSNILIAGFVIGGTTSKTVLVRASGPALITFGVSGVLPDPELVLNNSSGVIATNIGWGGNPQIASEAAAVGAFSWGSSATVDSALLVTLPPGVYTAEVSGASGDTGIALVEVYEVQ